MSSKPSKGKRQDVIIAEAEQKYNLTKTFESIDLLASQKISPTEASELATDLKKFIITSSKLIETSEHIWQNDEKIQGHYESVITNQSETIDYWKGLSDRQNDLIDSQKKLITMLEERDRYITENFDIPNDFDDESDGDGGEGDEKE
ncbi:MAG: hypothetical protein LUD47_04630 [Clostridia bacterium]|nr:hypothetical protein [Clostridia bacterium]